MANHDFKYFYEDEVFRITKKGALQFGMVIENAEFASSDESSDDDEQPVKDGQIRVAWYPQGSEEVVSERKVHLADRSLMPGDVVRFGLVGTQEDILIHLFPTGGWFRVKTHRGATAEMLRFTPVSRSLELTMLSSE